jgi:hypothetical protein
MEHLLAMILTAFDPRVNPAASLLKCHASQTCGSLVQLLRTADASAATAGDYTKNSENMHRRYDARPLHKALTASGRVMYVRAEKYA